MKTVIGRPGTASGLLLRVGQCVFAVASITLMVTSFGFSGYTAFCYLIASMGLQLLWSFGLACLDACAMRMKRDLQTAALVSLFVVGDWVTATLSFAAACSSAGVMVLYARDLGFCKRHLNLPCERFELSIALSFVTWMLTAISSHIAFWILASL